MSRSVQYIVSAEQRYKFHRTARYLLAVPIVFLLAWWTAALILAVLPFESVLRIAAFVAIFAILACALLWYLFKRYKNFKPSKLFVENPNLSLLLFTVENLSLGAFYGGFLACLAERYFWGEQAASWSAPFVFAFAPFCLIVFAISYVYEKSQTYAPFAPAKFYLSRDTDLGADLALASWVLFKI